MEKRIGQTMTTLYLGFAPNQVDSTFIKRPEIPISFLANCPQYDLWEKHRDKLNIRKWCLDSGAYSVFNAGLEYEYAEWLKVARIASESDCDEIFALDVIGDYKASWDNYQQAIADGVDAIPTFHIGEPWSYLDQMKKVAPKIALGVAKQKGNRRDRFIRDCFARLLAA